MDSIVEAALRKWPNVPHCHGWLALDARGDWYMRDERVQAAGPFPQVKGSVIRHDKLREFIHRNYLRDERGGAYFQNGPQRVYVELEAAPYVWRVQQDPSGAQVWQVTAHTGEAAQRVDSAWLDEQGRLYLSCTLPSVGPAFGLVHTMDMLAAAGAVESGRWMPQDMACADMPACFGFQRTPRP
ncbi:MAG: DUF2946 family protein [Betaproteobacteria bacterium]|jgi:hypothetical protein